MLSDLTWWSMDWQEEAVQLVVEIMDDYSLNQEDVDTIHEISKFKVCQDITLKLLELSS